MPLITLSRGTHGTVRNQLDDGAWCVACMCAAWCDVCVAFRGSFEALAALHPDLLFVWIDIEDEADLVGDIDVENFPTLLIQRADQVCFFGPVEPDTRSIERLIQAQTHTHGAASGADQHVDLLVRLRDLA